MDASEGIVLGAKEPARPTRGTIILLGALTAFGAMSIDMYLPGLPAIARDFDVSAAAAQLTVAAYLFGNAFGPLLYGPLSDRIGRRTPLLAGIVCYGLATLGCAFAPSVTLLTAFRFLQAVGGCAGQVIARAIVRDRFPVAEAARIYSLLTLVLGVAPILAPSLGSLLVGALGWRGIFAVLALFSIGCLAAAYFRLPESRHPSDRERSRGESLRASIAAVLGNRRILGYLLAGGFSSFAMFAYIASAPDVLINMYHVSPSGFGIAFGINALGYIGAGQVNRVLLRHHSFDHILRVAMLCAVLSGGLLFCNAQLALFGLAGVLVPLFLTMSSLGMIQPNSLAGAMSSDPHRTGTISALFGLIQGALASAGASLAAAGHDGTARPMAWVIGIGLMGALIAVQTLVRQSKA